MGKNRNLRQGDYNAGSNKFWKHLQSANRLHRKIGEHYDALLEDLRRDGVAFKDIKNRLLKEAKRAGLYRRNVVGKNGMDFASQTALRNQGVKWFHDLNLFLQYVKRNYTNYGEKVRKETKLKYAGVDKKKSVSVVRRTTNESGEVTETRTDIVGADRESLVGPVGADLSLVQKQTLIMQNWAVLGGMAQEKSKDALEAFNLFMITLGLDHEVIEDDEFANEDVRPQILSNEAPINGPFAAGSNPVVNTVQ